ncbi:MAG: hypothetical protein ACYDDZ_14490, partial [Acidimicrobiales bacterium]
MTVGISELPPEGMQLGGVALAGDAEKGTKTTEGLSLLFTSAGITVQGPQPQIERLLIWSGLDTATCSEKTLLADGRSAAVMELTSGGQSIRFFLPTENVTPGQAAYLDQALPAWLNRYRDVSGSPPAGSASMGPVVAEGDGSPPGPTTQRVEPSPPGGADHGTVAPSAPAAAATVGAEAAASSALGHGHPAASIVRPSEDVAPPPPP